MSDHPGAYTYAVAVFREDGSAVAQVPVDVDFEPAEEWTRFLGVRMGLSTQEAFAGACVVEPSWHEESGEPYLEGVRVSLPADAGMDGPSHVFSSVYFHAAAQEAGTRLVEEGRLEDGERFRFHPQAFPKSPSGENGKSHSFGAVRKAPHLSITEGSIAELEGRAGFRSSLGDSGIPVFVPQRILDETAALAVDAGEQETGGILIGFLRRDPGAQEAFVEITAQIPAEYAEGSATRLSFTAEAWTAVRSALDLRKRGEIMLGWWHSHVQSALCRDCSPEKQATCRFRESFFSAHDHALHRTVFARAHSVALVVNVVVDGPPTHSLFGWSEGLIQPRALDVGDGDHQALAPECAPMGANDA